jgi:hypothetical protein
MNVVVVGTGSADPWTPFVAGVECPKNRQTQVM